MFGRQMKLYSVVVDGSRSIVQQARLEAVPAGGVLAGSGTTACSKTRPLLKQISFQIDRSLRGTVALLNLSQQAHQVRLCLN